MCVWHCAERGRGWQREKELTKANRTGVRRALKNGRQELLKRYHVNGVKKKNDCKFYLEGLEKIQRGK